MFLSSTTLLSLVSTLFFLHGVIARPLCPARIRGNSIVHGDSELQAPEPFEHLVSDRALSKHCASSTNAAPVTRSNSLPQKAKAAGEEDIYKRGRRQQQQPQKFWMENTAKEELDKLNLHGKQRKHVIKWHKDQLRDHMKQNPMFQNVQATKIHHIAHEGGSDPNEKNHITASFRIQDKIRLPNTFNGGGLHHIYIDSKNPGLNAQGQAALTHNNNMIKQRAKSTMSAPKPAYKQRTNSKPTLKTHNNMMKHRANNNMSGSKTHK